ncbi:MAG: hypothetical protein ACFBWO_10120 [Paracoccaceae bacterium]
MTDDSDIAGAASADIDPHYHALTSVWAGTAEIAAVGLGASILSLVVVLYMLRRGRRSSRRD